MNQRSQATPFIPRELWTAPQLADYLGKPIKYVYRLTHERRIDHYVIGKELRFDPEHVAAFLGEAHYEADDEPTQEEPSRPRRGRPRNSHDVGRVAS